MISLDSLPAITDEAPLAGPAASAASVQSAADIKRGPDASGAAQPLITTNAQPPRPGAPEQAPEAKADADACVRALSIDLVFHRVHDFATPLASVRLGCTCRALNHTMRVLAVTIYSGFPARLIRSTRW